MDQAPNPYPLSPQAQALNEFLARKQAAAQQAIESAKAAVGGSIGSAADGVMGALAPNERQLAAQAAWAERLRASRANPSVLAQMLTTLRGPQMPAAIPRGSLAEILNAQRVANPNPSATPWPMIGARN